MNTDPVLIDDEDVNTEDIVIIEDDDDKVNDKRNEIQTVETIDLDDESPNINSAETVNNDADSKETELTNNSEESFVRSLENNRLMDKIVTRCLTMENAVGMRRVIEKTVLPLYTNTNNRFKESQSFTNLLKKIYKLLKRDPDHKFLHIKTLCEEMKSGVLKRKVHFVTLATNLNNDGAQCRNTEIKSSSRAVNANNAANLSTKRCTRFVDRLAGKHDKNNQFCKVNTKNNIKRKNKSSTVIKRTKGSSINEDKKQRTSSTRVLKEKTDVIHLDISDNETDNDKGKNDIIIVDETESSENKNDNSSKATQEIDSNKNIQENDSNITSLENDSSKSSNERGSSNKENYLIENANHLRSDDDLGYELLIPLEHVQVMYENEVSHIPKVDVMIENKISRTPKVDSMKVERIEREIACYKREIAKLEVAEVNLNLNSEYLSPYIQCSKLKKKIVDCYKQIYEMYGNSEDIVKRRKIRLHVAEGHPPGPTKMLERFLNDLIGSTGTVPFPDFTDVARCVFRANKADSLGWNKQRVLQEAAALFRQCGQALRKSRQKREYRDLLSLVRDQNHTDDPAERDPLLLAKLEQNKLIAKIKEEEILKRYVNMEKNMASEIVNRRVSNLVEFESRQHSTDSGRYSSDSDSDTELNVRLNNNSIVTTTTINKQFRIENSVTINNDINNLDVTVTAKISNQCEIGECSKHTGPIINNLDVKPENRVVENVTNTKIYENEMNSKNNVVNLNGNPENVLVIHGSRNLNDVQNYITSSSGVAQNNGPSMINPEDIKIEDNTKSESIDVQKMLDELGDNFVCTVFDIQDPFLVIEISSDGFSDDELPK